jgi:hypothetical protein
MSTPDYGTFPAARTERVGNTVRVLPNMPIAHRALVRKSVKIHGIFPVKCTHGLPPPPTIQGYLS